MISKSKTNIVRGLKVLYILPLVCISLAVNAEEKINYVMPDKGKDIKNIPELKDTNLMTSKIDTIVYVGSDEARVFQFDRDTTMVKDEGTIVIKATSRENKEMTNVLMVCDGKIIGHDELNAIPLEKIESMNIYKDNGEETKEFITKFNIKTPVEGVIVITLKKEE